ncbi:MAG: type II secretion system protein N [Pseudomonadales bacterium]
MLNSPAALRLQSLPPQLVFAVVAVLITVIFVWQGVGLLATWRGEEVANTRLAIRSAGSAGSGIGLEQVAKLHLFGEKVIAPVIEPVQTDIPQTNLKFVLVGAMTSSDAAKASALITTDKQTRRFLWGIALLLAWCCRKCMQMPLCSSATGNWRTLSFPRADESATERAAQKCWFGSRFCASATNGNSPVDRALNAPAANRFLHGNSLDRVVPCGQVAGESCKYRLSIVFS